MTTTHYPSERTAAALLAARIAATNRETAQDDYRRALRDAARAGCTYAELASTLGLTRQSVRQYLLTN